MQYCWHQEGNTNNVLTEHCLRLAAERTKRILHVGRAAPLAVRSSCLATLPKLPARYLVKQLPLTSHSNYSVEDDRRNCCLSKLHRLARKFRAGSSVHVGRRPRTDAESNVSRTASRMRCSALPYGKPGRAHKL